MNELTPYAQQLPDTIEDLSKFVLVGTEKMKALKAEIKAIEKLRLAEEVYDQKRDEARMLSELIIDASVRMGELKASIPKASGGDRKSQNIKSNPNDTFDNRSKGVTKTYKDLGFSKKQMYEFETMAKNPDIVERVKQEARDNEVLPTKSRIIDLAQQRKKKESIEQEKEANYSAYVDECSAIWKRFHKALTAFITVETDPVTLNKWKEAIELEKTQEKAREEAAYYLNYVTEDISKLLVIQKFLKEVKK